MNNFIRFIGAIPIIFAAVIAIVITIFCTPFMVLFINVFRGNENIVNAVRTTYCLPTRAVHDAYAWLHEVTT